MSTLTLQKLLDDHKHFDTYLIKFGEKPSNYQSTMDKFIKLAKISAEKNLLQENEKILVNFYYFETAAKSANTLFEIATMCFHYRNENVESITGALNLAEVELTRTENELTRTKDELKAIKSELKVLKSTPVPSIAEVSLELLGSNGSASQYLEVLRTSFDQNINFNTELSRSLNSTKVRLISLIEDLTTSQMFSGGNYKRNEYIETVKRPITDIISTVDNANNSMKHNRSLINLR